MTNRETVLLDDIEAWRKAKVAKIDDWNYIRTVAHGDPVRIDMCAVDRGMRSTPRVELEPEMIAAIDKVREAIAELEVARAAIIARKMRELRELT